MKIEVAAGLPPGDYAELVACVPDHLIHASPEWAAFTQLVCPRARPIYFIARAGQRPIGALPAFEMDGSCGKVLNSLPYYGSHGDFLVAPDVERSQVVEALTQALQEYTQGENVSALNIVAHPFRHDDAEFRACPNVRRVDDRIGQISTFPTEASAFPEETIMTVFSQKTRNLVRKGLKSGFKVLRSESDSDLRQLHEHHELGMRRIGGLAKPFEHLAGLKRIFGSKFHVHVAQLEGVFAGGLVTLTHRNWVEYFMPVSVEEHRSKQVLSALIYHAMVDYARQGFRHWNWGGTWRTQEGVYHFKKGWGARDYVYGYYGYAITEAFLGVPRAELLAAYPNFYLFPFTPSEI